VQSSHLSTCGKELTVLFAEVSWISWTLNLLVLLTGCVLIFLVLIQRGKGGGLAGAFGGVGGSSAFGSRAGDIFTRVTIIVAAFWILLIGVHVWLIQHTRESPADNTLMGQSNK
jgi:preprotein translocase subunit SecG